MRRWGTALIRRVGVVPTGRDPCVSLPSGYSSQSLLASEGKPHGLINPCRVNWALLRPVGESSRAPLLSKRAVPQLSGDTVRRQRQRSAAGGVISANSRYQIGRERLMKCGGHWGGAVPPKFKREAGLWTTKHALGTAERGELSSIRECGSCAPRTPRRAALGTFRSAVPSAGKGSPLLPVPHNSAPRSPPSIPKHPHWVPKRLPPLLLVPSPFSPRFAQGQH